MKRTLGKITAIFVLTALLGVSGCGKAGLASDNESGQKTGSSQVKTTTTSRQNALLGVTVNTTVRKTGQYPESFVLEYEDEISVKELDPTLFKLQGKAGMWGSDDTRDFECSFESVEADGKSLTLVPKDFPEKYFYVQDFTVTCEEHPEFDFTNKDISSIVTPVADSFETKHNDSTISFDYKLFTPKEDKNMPIVVVFHGYGDTSNLLTYRTAVEWAEPENQQVRPCYVLAPVIEGDTYFGPADRDKIYTALKDILDGMISEGKVNPDKVYIMGNSYGGVATIEYCEKYPESVAAALALCPALNYATNATMNLKNMLDVPVWFAQATHDNTIPVSASQIAVKSLEKQGAKEVKYTEYSDEEMNAAGADSAPDSTYSYHHVELAVMEDPAYQEWLFSH